MIYDDKNVMTYHLVSSANFLTPNEVQTRYELSKDAVAAFGINPLKAYKRCLNGHRTHLYNRTEDQNYWRYVSCVARRNEATAEHARRWWRWHEQHSAGLAEQSLEPPTPPWIRSLVHFEARRRAWLTRLETQQVPIATAPSEPKRQNKKSKRKRGRAEEIDLQLCRLVAAFEDPDSSDYKPDWKKTDAALAMRMRRASLSDKYTDGRPYYPKFEARYKAQQRRFEEERRSRTERFS